MPPKRKGGVEKRGWGRPATSIRRQGTRTTKRKDTPEELSTNSSEDIPAVPRGKAQMTNRYKDDEDELQEDVLPKPIKSSTKRKAAEMIGATDDANRWNDPTVEQLDTYVKEAYRAGLHAMIISQNMLKYVNELVLALTDDHISTKDIKALVKRVKKERYG
jgi:hypothetical protein